MTKSPTLVPVLVGGSILLTIGGCGHPQAGANGVPFPAPKAAPSAQVQIQQIQSDPHIPASAKPGIEAAILQHNSGTANRMPAGGQ